MIEINLIGKKKSFKMPTVLGVDLSIVNVKALVAVLVLVFFGRSYFQDHYRGLSRSKSAQIDELSTQLRNAREELQSAGPLRAELESYNQAVERLKERSEQVRVIINQRSNPRLILESLARNMPEDMWIDSIELSRDRNVLLVGGAESYSSIGNFIIEVNQTNFFDEMNLVNSNTEEILEGGVTRRIEAFEIRGKITSYDTRVQ
jgi:Tfp pilus assembly protein PilN